MTNSEQSFKEQILKELEAANKEREERRRLLLEQEEKARQAEEAARLEAERQAQLAEELARREAEEAERQAALEAQLAEIARQEEETRLAEERRQLEEAARLEAERLAQQEREAQLEAERQAQLELARLRQHQAELEEARQEELRQIEAEEAELARLEAARQEHLERLARLEARKAAIETEQADTQSYTFQKDLSVLAPTSAPVYGETDVETVLAADRVLSQTESADPVQGWADAELSRESELDFELDDLEEDDLDSLDYETTKSDKLDKGRETSRVANRISAVLASLILIMLLLTTFLGYRWVSSAVNPLDAESTEYVQVEIPSGSGNKLIGQILEENGIIKSGMVFNYYTKFKNYTNFQSGYYNFQKSMSLHDISQLLQEGGTPEPVRPALGKVLIPEGYTLTQIASAVTKNAASQSGKATPFSEEDFLATVQDPAFIESMVAKYPLLLASLPDAYSVNYQLEGYLFPATYDYYEETTVEDLIDQMLAAMDANLAVYYDSIANRGMTVNDILTLASLVEKEGATDGDRKQIASVFYNRLGIGMPLQSNIAILYAMDKLGEKTTLVEDATIDTSIDSPYNIYLNPGLMPGPVDSPGLSAIKATIEPDDTDYLYFVADVTTGIVYYAETFEEHSENVETYVNSNL